MSSQKLHILLTGGGSGGHITPNLAIIAKLQARNLPIDFLYICSYSQLDRKILKQENLNFHPIFTWKIRRYFSFKTIFEFFLFGLGIFQSFYYLIRFWPQIIITSGGFVSIPICLVGFILRRPILVYEADTVGGLANQLNHHLAQHTFTAFPLQKRASTYIGPLVHPETTRGHATKAYQLTKFRQKYPTLMIIGASQGSVFINQLVTPLLPVLVKKYQIIHLTGKNNQVKFQHPRYYQKTHLPAKTLYDFYQITDFAITRGSANTLAELSYNHIPMIIIPLSQSASNHQLKNAKFYAKNKQNIVLEEKSAIPQKLNELLNKLGTKKNKNIDLDDQSIKLINTIKQLLRY